MPLQTSGTITLAQIQTEFGGSNPIALNEYYRGGGLVPNTAANANIPTSGIIRLSNFYGGSNVVFSVVITGTENTLTQTTSSSDLSIRGFTLRTDGYTYDYANSSESVTFANWGSPVGSTGAGNNYWARVTATTTDPTPGLTLQGSTRNTWLQLNTARSFGYRKTTTGTTGTNEVEFQVEIATDAAGSNVVGTVLWTVRRTYV